MAKKDRAEGLRRRQFLGRASGFALGSWSSTNLFAQRPATPAETAGDLALVNGRIHTMDARNRVVSQALIQNGRFTTVANNLSLPKGVRRVDLKGRTVIPGLIDAHNHIVLVGNRPGWHTPLEHVFTIPEAIAALQARSAQVPARRNDHHGRPDLRHAVRRTPPAYARRAGCGRPTGLHPGCARRHENQQPGQSVARIEGRDGRCRRSDHRTRAPDRSAHAAQGAAHARDAQAVGP